MLIPGYGQTRLGRGTAAAVFGIVEVGSIGLARKAAQDLREAKSAPQDSVVAGYRSDPVTGLIARDPATGLPIPSGYITGRFNADRIKARRLHYEDWIAAIVFNHLFSGADAYVAANLWDFRTNVTVDPRTRRTTVAASISY